MKHFIVIVLTITICSNCLETPVNNSVQREFSDIAQLEKGQKIAAQTFLTLSSNLQKAMKEGGVSRAVTYCNSKAFPLVDSLELFYQATIKRTSLKVRNPLNKPTQEEHAQLLRYQKQLDKGESLEPVLLKNKEETIFHAPIFLMDVCQKCHGTRGEEVLEEDYEIIQSLYPNDLAMGYKSGELRGMWSITFSESK